MKATYINPEITVLAIASEDILTASPVQLDVGEWGMEDNFA